MALDCRDQLEERVILRDLDDFSLSAQRLV